MAMIHGVHLLAHGDKAEARRIAADIRQHQRLLVGTGTFYGAGVYAWYAEQLPVRLQYHPYVEFTIDETRIRPVTTPTGSSLGFFLIPGAPGEYVAVEVVSFANLT